MRGLARDGCRSLLAARVSRLAGARPLHQPHETCQRISISSRPEAPLRRDRLAVHPPAVTRFHGLEAAVRTSMQTVAPNARAQVRIVVPRREPLRMRDRRPGLATLAVRPVAKAAA